MFLLISCPLIALGIPSAIFIFWHPHQPNAQYTTLEGCAVGGLIALPIGVGMLMCCLFTLPAARRARMIFSEFEAGKYLARWKYDETYWHEYIEGEARRLRKVSYGTFGIIVAGGLFIFIIMMVDLPGPGRVKAIDGSIMVAVTLAVAFMFASIVRAYANSRCQRLARCDEAIIATHAAYMGGDLAFWGYGMRALQGARFVPGNPAMIELVVGLTSTARNATRIVDVVSAVTASPAYSSQNSQVELVPAPPGDEAAAREIVKTLGELYLQPPAIHSTTQATGLGVPAITSTATIVPAPRAIRSASRVKVARVAVPWETLHRRARRWWHITGAMAVTGISLFFAAVVLDVNAPSPHPPTVGDSLASLGFVAVILAIVMVPVAVLKSYLARRQRRKRNEEMYPPPDGID